MMGNNSIQAFAIVVFLVAFTLLGAAMALGGNTPLMLLFVVGSGCSAVLFRKAKSWECRQEDRGEHAGRVGGENPKTRLALPTDR